MKFANVLLYMIYTFALLSVVGADCDPGTQASTSHSWTKYASSTCSQKTEIVAGNDVNSITDTCKTECINAGGPETCAAIDVSHDGVCSFCPAPVAFSGTGGTQADVYYLTSTTVCEDCAHNFYSTTGAECAACPYNYVTAQDRSTSLNDCKPPGCTEAGTQQVSVSKYWINTAENTACVDKTTGFYALGPHIKTDCTDLCEETENCWAIEITSNYCHLCTSLDRIDKTGSLTEATYQVVNCADCAQDFYSNVTSSGFFECVACPSGFTTVSSKSTSIDDCLPPPTTSTSITTTPAPTTGWTYEFVNGGCFAIAAVAEQSQPTAEDCIALVENSATEYNVIFYQENSYCWFYQASADDLDKFADPSTANCNPMPYFDFFTTILKVPEIVATVCDAGQGWDAVQESCTSCVEGKYSFNNLCIACADGTTSPVGSDAIDDCVYCGAGKYSSNNICTACESGQSSPPASLNELDCYHCLQGKYAVDNICIDCAPGETSDTASESTADCYECPAGKYAQTILTQVGVQELNRTVCTFCPSYSNSVPGSSYCTCDDGYIGCLNCTEYKDCKQCTPTTLYYDREEHVCLSCPAGKFTVNNNDESCVCEPGYTYSESGECTLCEAGKYKTNYGDDACEVCEGLVGYVQEAATSCAGCMSNSQSVQGDCQCNAGFYEDSLGQDFQCRQCEAGTYKTDIGNHACIDCSSAYGPYSISNHDFTDCVCDATYAPTGAICECDNKQTVCVCAVGFYLVDADVACVQCEDGKFKSSASTSPCTVCETDFDGVQLLSNEDNTGCICPDEKHVPFHNGYRLDAYRQEGATCRCDAGYRQDGATCILCDEGKYKELDDLHNDHCWTCPPFALVPENRTSCTCPSNSVNVYSDLDCQCNAGYTGDRMLNAQPNFCTACAAGSYKSTVGTDDCTACPQNTYTFFTTAATSILDCLCNAGYEPVGGVCKACAVGKYSNAAEWSCTTCDADKITLNTAADSVDMCVCDAGYYHDYDNTCTQCPTGYVKLQAGNSVCSPCPVDTKWVASDQTCSPCPYNYNTNDQTAQTLCAFCNQFFQYTSSGCECMPGYQPDAETCSVCPDSTVKAQISSANCEPCAEHQTNNADSTACVCDAGYEGTVDGGELTCTLCSENMFKNTAGNEVCVLCGNGLTADATRTSCVCNANTENQDGVCVACNQNEESQPGGICRCMAGYARLTDGGDCVVVEEKCNVNERLPRFAVKLEHKNDFSTSQSSTRFASREEGGVCHMRRLMQVNNSLSSTMNMHSENKKHSIQYCTHNDTSITCSMLEQNSADVEQSYVYMDAYSAQVGQAAARKPKHYKERLCSQCDAHQIDKIFSRLNAEENIEANADRQMSFGEPFRISPARMMYSRLHRAVCRTDATCDKLQQAIVRNMSTAEEAAWCGADDDHTDCMSRSTFSKALLMPQTYSDQAIALSTDALWARNWVFCPHDRNEQKPCSGSVDKATWLDASLRPEACAVAMNTVTREDRAPVHFCLLNADTEELCSKLVQWREDVRSILCEAAGLCPSTDFFYFPGMFNMHEQEFVYDSVTRFYVQDTQQQCYENTIAADGVVEQCTPATALLYGESSKPACFIGNAGNAQVDSNAVFMQDCASVSIEPFVVITQQLRTIKQMLLLILYHYLRIQWQLAHVLVAVIIDQVTDYTQTTTDVVQAAAAKLVREVVAFVQSISKLFDVLKESVVALFYSRGIGGWLKTTIEVICQIVEWLHNIVWAEFICPMMKFVLDFATTINNFLQDLVGVIGRIPGVPTQWATDILLILESILLSVQDFLKDCSQKDFSCTDDMTGIPKPEPTGALPMPTRCWSTYLTFFGDNQQLQCTAADTCRAQGAMGLSASEYIVCGRCPKLQNSNIRDYGCDAVTKLCSCAVPVVHTSHCSTNDDCLIPDTNTACNLIKNDLTLSKTTILCDECQYQRTCLHDVVTGLGTCACGFQRTPFQTCTAADVASQNAITLMYNNLCLYSSSRLWLTFQTELTIPCQDLDATSGSCAWVSDLQKYLVRGYRTVGRRLLQAESTPAGVLYETLDPLCRDALAMPQLSHTRQACRKAYLDSVATLTQLDLLQHIHECALCSLSDLKESIVSHPLIWIHVATRPKVLMQIVKRHGILQEFISFSTAVYHSLHTVHRLLHDENGTQLFYFVHNTTTNISSVVIDEKIVPKHIVHAIYRLQNSFSSHALAPPPDSPDSADGANSDNSDNATGTVHSSLSNRQLLFFRELIKSVQTGVEQGWEQADRLSDNFVSGVSLMHNYKYVPSADAQEFTTVQWPPYNADAEAQTCSELAELLNISIRVANGMLLGLLTLTNQRDTIQRTPASSLRNAWPRLEQPSGEYAVPAQLLHWNQTNGDPVVSVTIDALDWVFTFIGFDPVDVYNLFYSLTVVARDSFECPYEAVQSCSDWRVRLWQGFIIVTFWFSIVSFVMGIFGISFASQFLLPLHTLVLLQLCYGFTWTCFPMIPICAWQDFVESFDTVFPLQILIPDELKHTSAECVHAVLKPGAGCEDYNTRTSGVVASNTTHCIFLSKYPSAACLKTCKDAPFEYESVLDVIAWAIAEVGNWAVRYVSNNAHRVPFLDDEAFVFNVVDRVNQLDRGKASLIRAHRICAVLSSYMLIPYILFFLVALAYVMTLVQLLGAQLYPFILCATSLFAAVAVRDDAANEQDDEYANGQNDNAEFNPGTRGTTETT